MEKKTDRQTHGYTDRRMDRHINIKKVSQDDHKLLSGSVTIFEITCFQKDGKGQMRLLRCSSRDRLFQGKKAQVE